MVVVTSLDAGTTTIIWKRSVTSATSELLTSNVTSADRLIPGPEVGPREPKVTITLSPRVNPLAMDGLRRVRQAAKGFGITG